MAALTRGVRLLSSAVGYALESARLATAELLARPTPCADWDLRLLLGHVADSMDVICAAVSAGIVPALGNDSRYPLEAQARGDDPRYPAAAPARDNDPAQCLRCRAVALLAACADAGPDERLVLIGDRAMPASMTMLAGALEIAVHGWDIAVACGRRRPVPPGLAAILLPVAPLLVTPAIRPGLFADPVDAPAGSPPGDELVAFLGRRPMSARAGRS
jgi:uncharacterized protein (TIGR03086 family)